MELKDLIGRTITGIAVSPDQDTLYLQTSTTWLEIDTYGDCCSETWFSDILNFPALLGTVAGAEELELPDYDTDDGRGRQEEDSVYGIKITTENGAATIAFRNSSNGYYGGSIRSITECKEPGADCARITDDWKA